MQTSCIIIGDISKYKIIVGAYKNNSYYSCRRKVVFDKQGRKNRKFAKLMAQLKYHDRFEFIDIAK